MTLDDLAFRIRHIVSETMDIPIGEIQASTDVRNDLGAGDLESIEIIMAIEDAFPPAEFSDAEVADCRTVADLVAHLAPKVGLLEVAA